MNKNSIDCNEFGVLITGLFYKISQKWWHSIFKDFKQLLQIAIDTDSYNSGQYILCKYVYFKGLHAELIDIFNENLCLIYLYKCLVLSLYVRPTALERWENIFDIDSNDWPNIFYSPYVSSRETKLQAFQYKVINRIIACNKWLYNIKIATSPDCLRCDDHSVDDIVHYFIECKQLDGFWNRLEQWWNHLSTCKIVITPKHVLFGLYYDNEYFAQINYIILLAKWYIYGQHRKNRSIDFYKFLPYLKCQLSQEEYICSIRNCNSFETRWKTIYCNM